MPDVVLPVLDEAEAIPWVLDRMPDGYSPVVVDNSSSDGLAQIAARMGALVVIEERRGFGAACWTGLRVASDDAGERARAPVGWEVAHNGTRG